MSAKRRARRVVLVDPDRAYEGLLRDLPGVLGEDYRVSAGHEYDAGGRAAPGTGPVPDLVVRDTNTGSAAVVEIKGGPGVDIPLASAPELAGLRARYGDEGGRRAGAVLVALAPVPELLKGWLLDDGVRVVEAAEDGDQVLSRVREAIRQALAGSTAASASYAPSAPRGFGEAAAPGQEVDRTAPAPRESAAVATVDVEAPISRVYDYWQNLENLPSFMKNIEEVRATGPDTTHWVVKGPLGYRAEFDARTTQEEPNSAIGWNSLDDDVQTSGEVRFQELGPELTRLEVQMEYADPGDAAGRLGEAASRITSGPKAMMEQDLRNFRDIIEGRTTPEEIRRRNKKSGRKIGPDRTDAERPPWERPGPLLAGGALLAWLLLRDGRSGGKAAAEDHDERLALLLAGGASLLYLLLERPGGGGRLSGLAAAAARRAQNLEENLREIFESIEYIGRESTAADEARRRETEKV